jgi:AMP phosphorylase
MSTNNKFKIKKLDMDAGKYTIVLNEKDAAKLGIRELDRVRFGFDKEYVVAVVNTTNSIVKPGIVGVMEDIGEKVGEVAEATVLPTERPTSVEIIKRKMNGQELSTEEIKKLVDDIVNRKLTDVELAAYVCANYMMGMNMRETADLTKAITYSGDLIEIDRKPIFDFHSVGGAPGNKVTLLVVPIIACADLTIPKTSSRAISSACGTADIFEVLAPVTLSIEQIRHITETVGGTIAWGGGVNIAPADDLIIRVEYPLSLDPHAQLIASVMAKKKAVNADYLLMDIPMGPGTKVPDEETAKKYARDFIDMGVRLDMKVECVITYGGQPIGRAIGPALEAREALAALEGKKSPASLIEKSTSLADVLLNMGGIHDGKQKAHEFIENGKALAKLKEIIGAQGGNPDITSEDVEIGEFSTEVCAANDGYVKAILNKSIVKIAREAGSPYDKKAGLVITKKEGMSVEKGDLLMTIYSSNQSKLERAKRLAKQLKPIRTEGMVLEIVRSAQVLK